MSVSTNTASRVGIDATAEELARLKGVALAAIKGES